MVSIRDSFTELPRHKKIIMLMVIPIWVLIVKPIKYLTKKFEE